MKKDKRKELEGSLYNIIHTHLANLDGKAVADLGKNIRKSSRVLARKFSRALRKLEKAKAKAASRKKVKSVKKKSLKR